MTIGDVIRTYRKKAGLTQEEMAKRLGVTAPAENQWENNNTLPDIALLAPISRLLGITTDILLGFQENLTTEEISAFIRKMNQDLDSRNYAEVFEQAKKKIEQYPNCELLIWQIAVILYAKLGLDHIAEKDDYDEVIFGWFERCLRSDDERIRRSAADSLFNVYIQKDDYDKAQSYLSWLASDSPERKRKEGLILSKTGKRQEAYRSYEELLFSNYQFLSLLLNDLKILYMEDENHEMAWKIVDMQNQAAKIFEMGRYNEVSSGLDVASWEKDASKTAQIMQQILKSIDQIGSFSQSDLYQHMTFKEYEEGFIEELRSKIMEEMSGESYSFMNGNELWQELMSKSSDSDVDSVGTESYLI